MSIYRDLIREMLLDPRSASRLAIPASDGSAEGMALARLADYCRGHGTATTAQIIQSFGDSLEASVFANVLAWTENQRKSNANNRQSLKVDHFLLSREWAALRMQALERDGARCAADGRTVADGVVINVDHIKNRRQYPELALTLDNLQVLCSECNKGKGNQFSTDWRRKPAKPRVAKRDDA